ncbi:MAG: LysE family translocator [Acidovorax sp.]|uniref:LysE family translocator n=1 Tax=Acidovorax sp. TaxID=1872122 RepID=UPI0025C6A207|nr:LysE family translocator [Acidovorax sp.]MCE1191645.1 LysE family translocator [Acidovorax sp.]
MSVSALVFGMGVFAVVGAITPGPVNILAVRHGAQGKPGVAMAYVLGASVSYALVVWLMGKGGEQLLGNQPLMLAMKWAGAGYLMYLAWRIATAPPAPLQAAATLEGDTAARAFADGGMAQSLNPKAWMVALSGVGLFVLPQTDVPAALAMFCGVSLLACSFGVGCWTVAGRVLTRWLAVPARQKFFNRAMGLLLAYSVVPMVQ